MGPWIRVFLVVIYAHTHIYTQAHIGLKRINMIVISIRTWVG
jgi:hypothetical protein